MKLNFKDTKYISGILLLISLLAIYFIERPRDGMLKCLNDKIKTNGHLNFTIASKTYTLRL